MSLTLVAPSAIATASWTKTTPRSQPGGTSYLPRPEDWPITSCEYVGFTPKPVGFFGRNPALDIPPSQKPSCRPSPHRHRVIRAGPVHA